MTHKTSLLIMDSDPNILKMAAVFFKKHGFGVFGAEDGEKGMELFHAQNPDLVLIDLRLPIVDGFEVLRTVTEESPQTPIIVVSGEEEKEDVIQALRLGAWNYLVKPIESFRVILHTVEQALDKARLIKENKAFQKGLEHKLSAIIENFPGFIYTCDHNCRITDMNNTMEEYIGQEVRGEYCHQIIFDQKTRCPMCLEEPFESGMATSHEIQNTKDGRWYSAIQLPVLDSTGQLKERQIILTDITEKKQAILDLEDREEYLRSENVRLRATLSDRFRFGDIIGKSKIMQAVYETIVDAAGTDASVIIYGESGTGKELVARAIHQNSVRKDKPLVYVNCGAIPETLIESEFFGYIKGAFTGANANKIGYLELADKGTLFLDEIGDIPMSTQIKLLRAIEGNGFRPVGGTGLKHPDFRIIAATNRDLKDLVREGRMRQDFLYRIHIIPIHVPPLRERREDIRLLIEHFMARYDPKDLPPLTEEIRKTMLNYNWPGNVRELENTIQRYVSIRKLDFMGMDVANVREDDTFSGISFKTENRSFHATVAEIEKQVILKALEDCGWLHGRTAQHLQLPPRTFYRKMKKLGIEKHAK